MYTALTVANFFLTYTSANSSHKFTKISINHAVYAAHSNYLIEFGNPLISDVVLATEMNGPIIPSLYKIFSKRRYKSWDNIIYKLPTGLSLYLDRKKASGLTELSISDCAFLLDFYNRFIPTCWVGRYDFFEKVCGIGTPWSEIFNGVDISTVKTLMKIKSNKLHSLKHLKKLSKNPKDCPKIYNSVIVASGHKFKYV